ncbi:hypothetical protein [Streptomyces sp. NPDC006012]|uniref:hypothetical protein n=1 Tax=Streptomyces sp. NPDC006012 TaxID=3364739 RepID=UPI00368E73D3
MTVATPSAVIERVLGWLSDLEVALAREDRAALGDLFREDCHWRDLAAFTWDVFQTSGLGSVAPGLLLPAAEVRPTGFALDPARPAPGHGTLGGEEIVEVFLEQPRIDALDGRLQDLGALRAEPVDAVLEHHLPVVLHQLLPR